MDADARFLVDGMLVKLGKYLRCLGYDAEWDLTAPTRELARRAEATQRILLTRSTRVGFELEPPPRWFRIESEDPVAQLHQVAGAFDLDMRARLFSRCILCNLELEPVRARESVRARVPERVYASHQDFYTCRRCGTIFWKGFHVENTCRKLRLPFP